MIADYIIIEVHKDSKNNIIKVKIGDDNIKNISNIKIKTKEEVINLLKAKKIIITAFKDEDGYFERGTKVIFYIDGNKNEQIKTISNKDDKDNLDNLPLF